MMTSCLLHVKVHALWMQRSKLLYPVALPTSSASEVPRLMVRVAPEFKRLLASDNFPESATCTLGARYGEVFFSFQYQYRLALLIIF